MYTVAGAILIASLANYEGYSDKAIQPIPGDKWTVGHGTTEIDGEAVTKDTVITPERATQLLQAQVDNIYAAAVKKCLTAPVYEYEYNAFVSLAYNIGTGAFCSSTLVRKANAGDYAGACKEILRWNKAQGEVVQGLVNRREDEYKTCIGEGA